MKKLVSLLLVAVMVLAFAAGCSTAKVEGKYVVKSIDGEAIVDYFKKQAEDAGIDLETMLSYAGLTEETITEFMTVELNEDKTAKMNAFGEDAVNGTWAQDGDKVTITVEGEDPAEFTFKNGQLTYKTTEDGVDHEMVLIKVGK